jgi:putative transposase
VYHVISRGNARQAIFRDDADREYFLGILEGVVFRHEWLCHAYVLMGNHYHLIVETPKPNLPIGMGQLNSEHAQSFNARYDRCGHVFQSRYRSILIERESQLLSNCRYVILNPVRAGLCTQPGEWPWSSYLATAGEAPVPRFLCTDVILGMFARSRAQAQAAYRAFVAEALPLEPDVVGERVGGEAFLRDRFGLDVPIPEIPRVQIEPLRRPLDEIFDHEPAPVLAAYRKHGYTLREIASHLGCHYSTVSRELRDEEADARVR